MANVSHDQNFKNLIIDYPRDARAFFAAEEAPGPDDGSRKAGWEYVHVAIDDASRVAFATIADDRHATAALRQQDRAACGRHMIHHPARIHFEVRERESRPRRISCPFDGTFGR